MSPMIEWQVALTVVVCTAAALFLWWFRDRHLAEQRRGMRALYTLSEEIISAHSPSEILRQLLATLPRVSSVSSVRLYLLNRKGRMLDRVPSSIDPNPISLPLDSETGPALCVRDRTLLTIPDTYRSPLYDTESDPNAPPSVMLVPMCAEREILGVLELDHNDGVRQFSPDQQAAAQHLANQVAIALKLQAQESVREQLFRSEKLAAAGQLVSGVVTELQEPLNSLAARAASVAALVQDRGLRRDLDVIAAESKRASEIVARLVNFSRAEQSKASPVELNDLLGELIKFREREWRVRGVGLRNLMSEEPLTVLGSGPQLERVFLDLLVHAEQSVEAAPLKVITVGTRRLAGRAIVEIGFSAQSGADEPDPFLESDRPASSNLGLPVCRGVVQSHGGEIRLRRDNDGGSHFEIELPLAPDATREQAEMRQRQTKNSRTLTVLLADTDPVSQRRLMALFSSRGHRVVPAGGAGEAVDWAQRLQFDLVCSSTSLPGANWVEFYERVRHLVPAFTLLTDGYNANISRAFQKSDSYVLSKPVDEGEFDRMLVSVEASTSRPGIRSSS